MLYLWVLKMFYWGGKKGSKVTNCILFVPRKLKKILKTSLHNRMQGTHTIGVGKGANLKVWSKIYRVARPSKRGENKRLGY